MINMSKKLCLKCNIEKKNCEFHKNTKSKDGLVPYCKECRKLISADYNKKYSDKISIKRKKYKEDNPEKIKSINKISTKKYKSKNQDKLKLQSKLYREKNKDKEKERHKLYKEKNKDKIKEYNSKNAEYIKNYKKNYYQKNKVIINEKMNEKYHSDSTFKLICLIRGRINKFLKIKNVGKNNSTFNMIGCSPLELKNHLEILFTEGMSWENHGLDGWHIDHIIPLSSAKTEEEIYQLCHYTNLQPLWAEDNLKKGDKLDYLL
jgi:hypothetical protein